MERALSMDYRNFERARKVMAESYVKDVRRERRRLANYYKRQRFYGVLILLAGALMIVCSYVFFMEFLRYLGLLAGIVGL